jgi:hypothetical protein
MTAGLLRQVGVDEHRRVVAQRPRESFAGGVPLGARVTEPLGDPDRAHQAAMRRRRSRQQRRAPHLAALLRPCDRATRQLHRQHELGCALDRRPHLGEERSVRLAAMQVPNTGGEVRRVIALLRDARDLATAPLRRPSAVVVLRLDHEAVRSARAVEPVHRRETHRGMHVIPGIHLEAIGPWDLARRLLPRRQPLCRELQLLGAQ